jgi:tRNA (adenine37-N6)-methyltransferase
MKKIGIVPIGRVRADDSTGSYSLEIDETYRAGLAALEEFGRIHVLWWANGIDEAKHRSILSCELPYAPGKTAGVFACRAEYRPNPIDMACCGILGVKRREGLVILDCIDALEGTPVLDLKPYVPVCDRARTVKVPEWFRSWPEWIEDGAEFFSREDAPNAK